MIGGCLYINNGIGRRLTQDEDGRKRTEPPARRYRSTQTVDVKHLLGRYDYGGKIHDKPRSAGIILAMRDRRNCQDNTDTLIHIYKQKYIYAQNLEMIGSQIDECAHDSILRF